MNHDWKIRVQPAERTPYVFKATFVRTRLGTATRARSTSVISTATATSRSSSRTWAPRAPEICSLIETLQQKPSAEIAVDVTEEAMEDAGQHGRLPGRREGRA